MYAKLHYKIAKDCIEAGVHTLIAKPFTPTYLEGKDLVDIAYKRATKVLTDNRSVLDEMATMLIEKETIDTEDIQNLLNRSEVKVANYI